MGNGWGDYRTNFRDDMRAYDALPAPMREILRNTVADYAAVSALKQLRERQAFGMTVDYRAIWGRLNQQDRAQCAKAYGPHHPEAQP